MPPFVGLEPNAPSGTEVAAFRFMAFHGLFLILYELNDKTTIPGVFVRSGAL